MATVTTSGTVAEAGWMPRPYAPSWMDRFTAWVDWLPLPNWTFYALLGFGLTLLEAAIKWSDGSYPVGTLEPFHVISAVGPVYGLGFLHYLDRVAAADLQTFRPVLLGDEAEYRAWAYRLTTMPSRPVLAMTALGLLVGLAVLGIMAATDTLHEGLLYTSPLAAVSDTVFSVVAWVTTLVNVYHTRRQLHLVSTIYATRTRVDLFSPGPLYALTGLTAQTAVGWSVAISCVLLTEPEPLRYTAAMLGVILGFVFMAVVVFIVPLLGIHHLLAAEKVRLQAEAGQRMKLAVAELHRRVDAGEMHEAGALNEIMTGLTTEQALLNRISTWPWRSDTVQLVITAVLFPLALWLVQRALDSLLH